MSLFKFLAPKPTISERELTAGLKWFTLEGAASLGLFSITTSGFLVAFALALGASNFQIGILAAIPSVMQILQLPAIWLVEKVRYRKLIAVPSWFLAQFIWFPIALIPVFKNDSILTGIYAVIITISFIIKYDQKDYLFFIFGFFIIFFFIFKFDIYFRFITCWYKNPLRFRFMIKSGIYFLLCIWHSTHNIRQCPS